MKRIVCLVMALVLLLSLVAGCGKKQNVQPQPASAVTTTLMIYMVGSDLEPKAGAGSADLEEIANSGIDLSCNKVVVCAGGSPNWHNENVDKEKINILALQQEGFVTATTMENASMGTAEQLGAFLDYCYKNYASDQYALILWDHGNGPVMGYGKDILYGNDALLLTEIAQAMKGSAFSGDNKLEWVGFDACLMASAELSCILADHAKYLIASQEIEPAFGWDYSFLSQLGKVETTQLLGRITEDYMAACDAYYKERNYENYDVTLSVVDLSCAEQLETAVNELFSAASGEVAHYYDLLAKNRVQSRGLGRATTGSEYDLVDLQDMTTQLSAQYPQLTKNLTDVISKMVLVNATSIEGCCGMSLYYPFYNKYYYGKDWKSIYSELNVFPAYVSYLEGYEASWLKEDKLEGLTFGAAPEKTAENTYSVTLNEAQAKSYADASYYILKRESGDLYRPMFNGQDVTWENNTLSVEYDGMAIYVHGGNGDTFIPPLTAVDQIERLYRYSGTFQLTNSTYQPQDIPDEELPEETANNWRYLLTLNSQTGKVELSGTVPYVETTAQDLVENGRVEEADFSQYGGLNFFQSKARYITRYENGTIMPLNQWYENDIINANMVPLANGYSFEYAPLAGGEYYMMFEITDTQSGVYCTELLPITVENVPKEPEKLAVTESKWEEGQERVLVKEQDGVKIYLTTRDTEYYGTRYFWEVENANDFDVEIGLTNIHVNDTLWTDNRNYITVKAYDFMYAELHLGICEAVTEVESISVDAYVVKDRSDANLWQKQRLRIDMSGAAAVDLPKGYVNIFNFAGPYMGARAEKQVIYASDTVRLTLMGIGEAADFSGEKKNVWVFIENLSDRTQNVGLYGYVINGCFFEASRSVTLAPGEQSYQYVWMSAEYEGAKLDQIQSLTLMVAASERELWWMNETPCIWCPVTLSQTGAKQTIQTGTLLWEENGVRVSVYRGNGYGGKWQIAVENNTDQDISLETVEESFDGATPEPAHIAVISGAKLGAGQRCIGSLSLYDLDDHPLPKEVSFRFQIRSFDETRVLHTATQSVTLTTK